jgi:hypothetical protein
VTDVRSSTTLDYSTLPVEPAASRSRLSVACLFVALVLGGLACPVLANFIFDSGTIFGLGRGRHLVIAISCVAIVASPLSCVAWSLRHTRSGKGLALVLMAVAFVADGNLLAGVYPSGVLVQAWSSNPSGFVGWLTLWTIWQALSARSLVRGEVRCR